jgi:hypothetical protein
MYICLHVKYQLFCQIFNDIWIFSIIFKKYSNSRSLENLSNGREAVLCGWTDGQADRQAGMKAMIVDFCNFLNAPKT